MKRPLSVRWWFPAERVLKMLPRGDAERVAAAVLRFAEGGLGDGERLPTSPETTLRLRVDGYVAMLAVDHRRETLWVMRLYRADR